MIKKVLAVIALLLLLFIILMYVSLWSTPDNKENSKILNVENIDSFDFKAHDSVLVSATSIYKANELKRLMQGEHYRKAWSTPIKVPIVFLDTLHGGMTILKEGGGHQTQSLKLLSTNGFEYAMRSINKNPEPLIPEFAKTLGIENIIVDGVSAQHPYGALVVAALSESIGVLQTYPTLVYIPKQKTLGAFNSKYGNHLYLLEYETESMKNWTHYNDVVQIMDTDKLQEFKMEAKDSLSIDTHALVRARLFDLIIGDWDRHAKQWGWVIQKQDGRYTAIPLPVDRDNAFFNLGGLIPNIIANKNVTPELRPFEEDINYLPGLVQPFDVYFLKNVPESVFMEEAEQLQKLLTDKAIDKALHVWPQAFYDLDGRDIENKIKHRRDHLLDYAKGFKKVLDGKDRLHVPLKGSEQLALSEAMMGCFECDSLSNQP